MRCASRSNQIAARCGQAVDDVIEARDLVVAQHLGRHGVAVAAARLARVRLVVPRVRARAREVLRARLPEHRRLARLPPEGLQLREQSRHFGFVLRQLRFRLSRLAVVMQRVVDHDDVSNGHQRRHVALLPLVPPLWKNKRPRAADDLRPLRLAAQPHAAQRRGAIVDALQPAMRCEGERVRDSGVIWA